MRVGLVVSTLLLAALAIAHAAEPGEASKVVATEEPRLPAAAQVALESFRQVPWAERCKPARADPAPDGWRTRVRAEAVLGSLSARDVPALRPLLADPDQFVRALAAKALGLTVDPTNTPALVAALAAERDKLVKVALLEALGRTGGDGALAAVDAQQIPTVDADVAWTIGFARRQLKSRRFDLANLRAEFAEVACMPATPAPVLREEAPELALAGVDRPVNLSRFRGGVVIIAFTHGDRDPVAERVLQRMSIEEATFAKSEVAILVVDPHEKDRMAAWAERIRLPFVTFAADPAARGASAYGIAKQMVVGGEWQPSPAWFIVDKKGRLVWRKVGRTQQDHASLGELMPIVEDLLRDVDLAR